MTREELQPRLSQTYQRPAWLDTLKAVLPATQLFAQPQAVPVEPKSAKVMHQLGRVRLQGGRQLAVLEIEVAESIDLVRNRVGLRSLVARIIDQAEYHGVLAVFISHEQDFRFTFAARESFFDDEGQIQRRETAARRFTYVLGPNESCRTAAERFSELAGKAHDATLEDVIAAFSVEKLNKEFFADFIRIFEKVAADIRKRHRWPEPVVQAEAQMLLNRLLFLYFVQRKGWLNRQRDYLVRNFREHYAAAPEGTSFYTQFLRPLFQRLSTEEAPPILPDHDVPFLNGGLFNDEYGDEQSDETAHRRSELRLGNETFHAVFEDLLERYNFTIYEDSPSHCEVAIDPEMLGRIFESVVLKEEESQSGGKSLRHDTGSHYTPRPIVHYLSREALAAWLESQPPFVGRAFQPAGSGDFPVASASITSLVPSPQPHRAGKPGEPADRNVCPTPARQRIDALLRLDASEGIDEPTRVELDRLLTPDEAAQLRDRLLGLRACDAAVGSGAFPMGLLHELLNLLRLCETRARGQDPVEGDRAWLYETKKRIIERVIYGVDIQDRAIEICKLRLWLSLMVDHDLGVNPFRCERRAFQGALRKLEPLPNLDFKIRRANSLRDTIHGEAVSLFRSGQGVSGELGLILRRLIEAKHSFYAARKAADKRRWRLDIYDCLSEMANYHLNQVKNEATGLILDEGNEVKVAEVARLTEALKQVSFIRAQIRQARRAKVHQQTEALERLQAYFDNEKTPTFVWELDFAEVFFRQPSIASTGGGGQGEGVSELALNSQSSTINRRSGFDLMLGNPPYVRIQTLNKQSPELAEFYKQRYISASKGNYDLYVCFVERGLELLHNYGQLAYILPHKFFNAQYGEPLRELIGTGKETLWAKHEGRHLRHVVHFGDQQIFPGATNYVCLLFLAKAGAKGGCRFVKANILKRWLRNLQGTTGTILAKDINATEWNFAVGEGADIFERLRELPVKLGDIADMFVGLQTSADTVFLFKDVQRSKSKTTKVRSKELGSEVEVESHLLKPVVRSGEIGRFWARPTALVLFPYRSTAFGHELIPDSVMRRDYPLAWKYLLANKDLLEQREHGKFKETGWYQLYPKNLDHWEKPKIMIPYMITDLAAWFDSDGLYFVNVTTGGFGLTLPQSSISLSFITALLNSPVVDWFFKKVSTTFHGGYFAANKQFLVQLPIRLLDLESPADCSRHDAIVLLVTWLLWLRRQPSVAESTREHPRDPLIAAYLEQWLNALVFELYFPAELHAAGLHFFDLTAQHTLPPLPEWNEKTERLPKTRECYEKLSVGGHALRIALDKLQTLDLVRIIEGKPTTNI